MKMNDDILEDALINKENKRNKTTSIAILSASALSSTSKKKKKKKKQHEKKNSVRSSTPRSTSPTLTSSSTSTSRKSGYYNNFKNIEKRRRSSRGNSSIALLAEMIVSSKNVVFITGAGLSVKSGIRPFRGDNGLWNEVIWTNGTREAFRRNPLDWYNNFWLKHFPPNYYDQEIYQPNDGHEAIAELTNLPKTNVYIITQNVDSLHTRTKCKWNWKERLIEAHGRVGLYKCIPEEDSDTDDDSDEDKDRMVKLGSRKKSRAMIKIVMDREKEQLKEKQQHQQNILGNKDIDVYDVDSNVIIRKKRHSLPPRKRWRIIETTLDQTIESNKESELSYKAKKRNICRYQVLDSIPVHKIQPLHIQSLLTNFSIQKVTDERNVTPDNNSNNDDGHEANDENSIQLNEVPRCLECGNPCPPQALLFDEGYHSHAFYRFMDMEDWITKADVLVFVGTSFAVSVTDVALSHARERSLPVYNFNLDNANCRLESTSRLNVENIMGDASVTLPNLLQACKEKLDIID